VSLRGFGLRGAALRNSEIKRMKLAAGTMKCCYFPADIAVARSRMA
jgi:hypothetical protein